ncbi:MAG: phosphoribosylamine--glycine ligase [Bacteroidota bacterium]
MDVLVIGSGGREHALVWKLAQSPKVGTLYCAPGNPGIATHARPVSIQPTDTGGLLTFAREHAVGLTVVGPEQPLALGIVDAFRAEGMRIFGPVRRAAEIEWSKAFAKEFMQRHGIPTAAFRVFKREESAEASLYVSRCPLPVVLKADGLAAGKGVMVCRTSAEATSAVSSMLEAGAFGSAGETVVVEEFLEGEEASVFAVTDGLRYVLLAPAQDHKRVFDGDQGKNTGGMGAYAPTPIVTPDILKRVGREIIAPTLRGMAAEGRTYRGCLYAGLMITGSGPRVVEFNCRFGDPESQVVLPLHEGDLLDLLIAASDGTLTTTIDRPRVTGSAVCVVIASGGYPDDYTKGKVIRGVDAASTLEDTMVFHAGTRIAPDGTLVTSGGRVLGVTALRRTGPLNATIAAAYDAVHRISFEGMHYRRDIGQKALRKTLE